MKTEMINIDDMNKHKIVRKAEALVNARYSMSLIAIKLITTVISQVNLKDDVFKTYRINAKDLAETLNMKSNGVIYTQIKKACDELVTSAIRYEDEYEYEIMSWVSRAKYTKDEGIIDIELSQFLKPILLELKNGKYLNYELKNVLGLKSSYLIRLYETLKNEHNKNMRYKKYKVTHYEMYIEELRERFQIPKSYSFKDIRVNIIEKAIEEFKEHTDIEISYQISRKLAKKVIAIEFTITDNGNKEPHLKTLGAYIKYLKVWEIEEDLWIEPGHRVRLSKRGVLYNAINKLNKNYSKKEANKIFEKLYERALDGKPIGIENEKM